MGQELVQQPVVANDFVTWSAMGDLGVAAVVVLTVSSGLGRLLGWSTPWVPFLVGLAVVIGTQNYLGQLVVGLNMDALSSLGLVVFNTFILFCTAMGMIESGQWAAKPKEASAGERQSRKARPFFSSWLR